MKRIIVIKKERRAYYLYANAPEVITTREELLQWSSHQRAMEPDEVLLRDPGGGYWVEERPDLAEEYE